MSLRDYFASADGTGIMSTADARGNVNAAVYARPHVLEDGNLAFVMTERQTYKNVIENPRAVYLFKESEGYTGKRLYLSLVGDDDDPERVERYRRRRYSDQQEARIKPLHLVSFRVERERPLVD